MTMLKWSWLAYLGLLVPTLAAAQPPGGATQNQSTEPHQAPKPLFRAVAGQQQASNSQKMYEDIEIMRRIINRKLGLWPGLVALNTNCTVCHVASGNHIRNLEGGFDFSAGAGGASAEQAGSDTSLAVAVTDFVQNGWPDVFMANGYHGYESAHASLSVPTNVEGVYLKGQGAVYTLILPLPPRSRPVATKKAATKPLTDWERALRSVRGDQPPPQKLEPAKESNQNGIFAELEKTGHLGLTEAILRLLAENGHHFSQMDPDEKITVAITFREPSHSTAGRNQTGTQTDDPLSAWGNVPGQESRMTWEGQSFPPGGGGSGLAGAAGGGMAGGGSGGGGMGTMGGRAGPAQTPSSIRDFELLGDRLLKQSKPQEAIKAFQRALNLNPPAKQSAALYRKIAQADLMVPDDEAAKKALAMAEENLKQAGDATNIGTSAGGGAGKATSPSSLPPKLIISAPKKLLDQVGSGKISYADFRRQAAIDFFAAP